MSQDWWRGAAIYQIYPRSFQDSDRDGVGDLKGIVRRLDHIKSLSVDGVWISPFFPSPMRDFGYDVADYCGVDPLFGSLQDFDTLIAAAHARGLKVIIDQVWSHSSSDHAWFQDSRQSRDNPKADWYVWADPRPDGSPPNNWQAWFGGAAWSWEPRRRQYYLHNFLSTQPDLNLRNPSVRDAIREVARFWLERGVDGFRLDVANYYVHDAQLRDNPPSGRSAPALPRDMQIHAWNSNQEETIGVLNELRALTDGYGARMMVAEVAPGSFDVMAAYTKGTDRLHTAYSFALLADWPGVEQLAAIITQWGEDQGDGWPSWAMSNHDVPRVAGRWATALGCSPDQAGPILFALLIGLRGTVFIYQGEELGLIDGEVPFERLRDPWGIAGWPATKGRDGCRTPMPWEAASTHGGFTDGDPWLPVDAHHVAQAVDRQDTRPGSMLSIARELLLIRAREKVLRLGGIRVLEAADNALVIERRGSTAAEGRVLLMYNFSAAARVSAHDGELLLGVGARRIGRGIELAPFGFAILKSA